MENKGVSSELAVTQWLTEHGYTVSTPVINDKYDIIVDIAGDLLKVQIKRGYEDSRPKSVRVKLMSCTYEDGGYVDKKYSTSDVDAFAVHYKEKIYWYWFDEAPSTEIRKKESSLRGDEIENKLL